MTTVKMTSKKIATFLLSLMMVLLATVPFFTKEASAWMWPTSSQSNMNIKTYITGGSNITAYTNANLSSKRGTIYPTDLITIKSVSGNSVEVQYPTGSGSKTGWISASQLSQGNLTGGYSLAMKSDAKLTVYRKETGSATIGSISKGDTVYLVYAGTNHETGRAQFIYPVSGGWKMGWVRFSDLNGHLRATGGGQTVKDGYYRLKVSGSHSVDSEGADSNIHVWETLNVSQQKNFYVKHIGNGVYTVKLHNGKYMDQKDGSYDPTSIWGYEWNNTNAQKWYIADLGNGRYCFFNVGSGLAMDVYCYQTNRNGADVMCYFYNGQHVTLERTDGGSVSNASSTSNSNSNSNKNTNLITVITPSINILTPTNSDSWIYPMNGAQVKSTSNNWSEYYAPKASVGRPDHAGLDLTSSSKDDQVFAAANGTVVYSGYNSANGNVVVLQHSLNGQTVYSFYAHLETRSVSKGQSVSQKTPIGSIGRSGQGSSSTGKHLHFAITNKLPGNPGGFLGYVKSFSGDKVTHSDDITYYNPHYVVKYNKLP